MFGKKYVNDLISRSAESAADQANAGKGPEA